PRPTPYLPTRPLRPPLPYTGPAPPPTYTLSLHDALPIFHAGPGGVTAARIDLQQLDVGRHTHAVTRDAAQRAVERREHRRAAERSEEHTSELQSHLNLVCRLLLEKKKTKLRL